jgi:hypothetical protein
MVCVPQVDFTKQVGVRRCQDSGGSRCTQKPAENHGDLVGRIDMGRQVAGVGVLTISTA